MLIRQRKEVFAVIYARWEIMSRSCMSGPRFQLYVYVFPRVKQILTHLNRRGTKASVLRMQIILERLIILYWLMGVGEAAVKHKSKTRAIIQNLSNIVEVQDLYYNSPIKVVAPQSDTLLQSKMSTAADRLGQIRFNGILRNTNSKYSFSSRERSLENLRPLDQNFSSIKTLQSPFKVRFSVNQMIFTTPDI